MSFYTDFPKYPTSVFNDTDYPNQTDDVDTCYAALVNALKEELQACFTELGTLPKGNFTSVKRRLEIIQEDVNIQVPSPIAHWKMNDNTANKTVVDAIGSYNGTAEQNTDQIDVTGKINGALTFNGSSDGIDVGHNDLIGGLTVASMSAWIKYDAGCAGSIINQPGLQDTNTNIEVNKVKFSAGFTSGVIALWSNTTLEAGTWYHIVCVVGASGMSIYVDGQKDGSNENTGTLDALHTSFNFGIGARYKITGIFDAYFDGVIDDLRIYNFALSQSEINGIYNFGAGTEDKNPQKQ